MKSIRHRISAMVRERIFRYYGIPFSRHWVDLCVVRFLQTSGPINVVDIGASEGRVTAALDAHYGVRRGLLVEPQPARCEQLRRRFPDPRYSIHECALSDRQGTCLMDLLNWDFSSSILPVRRDLQTVNAVLDLNVREKIECQVTTLDTIMREHWQNETVDLLKIDVQGAELMALRGGEQTLKRVRLLLTEVSFIPLYEGSCAFNELHSFLRDRGFRLLAFQEGFRGQDGELLQCDALFRSSDHR